MLNKNLTKTINPFWKQFLTKHKINNDIFVIEVDQTTFYIKSEVVIELIQNSSFKEQEYAERLLRLYELQNRDINKCLEEIATDYVKKNYRSSKKLL